MALVEATQYLLRDVLWNRRYGRAAVVSSFGAESAVLLHLVAGIAPETPVIFLDTGKLFDETRHYRDELADRLGLSDLRSIRPDATTLARDDAEETLWISDPDRCCKLRKVEPLDKALIGFDAWINGRKRFHGGSRADLATTEPAPGGRMKINPLADWSAGDVIAYFRAHDLPRHPLEAEGFRSIGCTTCTVRVEADVPARAGRWAGLAKTECGIHAPLPAEKAA